VGLENSAPDTTPNDLSSGEPASRPRLRVCIDADALFAGAASVRGASHLILQLGELGIIEVGVPTQARQEAERNLAVKLPAALPALRTILAASCLDLPMTPSAVVDAIAEAGEADPKDAPILAAALAGACAWLVTFNVRDYRSDRIRVATPGDFVAALRAELVHLGDKPST